MFDKGHFKRSKMFVLKDMREVFYNFQAALQKRPIGERDLSLMSPFLKKATLFLSPITTMSYFFFLQWCQETHARLE